MCFRDVISSQKLAFSAGHCSKINVLLKVSKLAKHYKHRKNLRDKFNWLLFVTDRLFKTLPWLLFISIFYDSPWSIFTAIQQIKNDQSDQALCWDKFGSDVTELAVHETVNNREYQARFHPCGYQFFKKIVILGMDHGLYFFCFCWMQMLYFWEFFLQTISQFISDISDFVGLLQLLALRHLLYLKKMFFKTPFNVYRLYIM